jgi:uncharacterized protein
MKLIDKVREQRNLARKEGKVEIELPLLSLLLGELESASKRDGSEITDEKVIAAAKKLIKSNNETEKLAGPSAKIVKENAILETFLPRQMSEEEIKKFIFESGALNIGEVMKALNSTYPGMFDKGMASKIAKEMFG